MSGFRLDSPSIGSLRAVDRVGLRRIEFGYHKGPREVGQDPGIVGLPSRDQVGQDPPVIVGRDNRTAAPGRIVGDRPIWSIAAPTQIVDRPDPSLPRSKGIRILPAVRREDRRPFPEPSEPSNIGRPHFSPFVEMGQSRPNFGRNGKNDRIFW
jgi:hypothetical protein